MAGNRRYREWPSRGLSDSKRQASGVLNNAIDTFMSDKAALDLWISGRKTGRNFRTPTFLAFTEPYDALLTDPRRKWRPHGDSNPGRIRERDVS